MRESASSVAFVFILLLGCVSCMERRHSIACLAVPMIYLRLSFNQVHCERATLKLYCETDDFEYVRIADFF